MVALDPSNLPGTHRSSVFIGGSYADKDRNLLGEIAASVITNGFDPVIADDYQLLIPDRDPKLRLPKPSVG